jgi:hypothetical protein
MQKRTKDRTQTAQKIDKKEKPRKVTLYEHSEKEEAHLITSA